MSKLALVVDDSLPVRRMVGAALESLGFEVALAVDGKAAFEHGIARNFGLVITDFNMPRMSGLEFMTELRGVDSYRFTPFIFLTTEIDADLQEQARRGGATAWLLKPFHAPKMVQLVQRLCP